MRKTEALAVALEHLNAAVPGATRGALRASPRAAIAHRGVLLRELKSPMPGDSCACDGWYISPRRAPVDTPTIAFLPTPNSRRENFTLTHEYGHAVADNHDELLSLLADIGDDGGVAAEEQLCDAFASEVLIPDAAVAQVVGTGRPLAEHVGLLYQHSAGSLEACAVRLAQKLPASGYVTILNPEARTLRFAASSPSSQYRWRRGSDVAPGHLALQAKDGKGSRGQAAVTWSSGSSVSMFVDAVTEGRWIVAIFSEVKYWDDGQLSILSDPAVQRDRGTVFSGTCRHCGGPAYGLSACSVCGDARCKRCGKCGCGAAAPAERVCEKCHMKKGKALFTRGASVCRECA